jgi:DNA-binding transcriptional MerR regulator
MLQSTMPSARSTDRRSAAGALTVDEVARRTGTTTRNVRALQTLGLVRPPELRGRTGLYGEDHLARIRAVLHLQRSGFSLGAIAALFEAWEAGSTLEQVLGLPPAGARPLRRDVDDDVDDVLSAFDDWPVRRRDHGVAVVPTTLLHTLAS